MSLPYPGTSVTGYNANPPPDDGSQVATNEVTWSGIKTKIGDPLDTFAGNVDSNLTAAFEKLMDGSAVVSTATSYAAGAADQGKLIVSTASGITITTPDAGTVGAPFVFAINNQSTGNITLAGNATNSQTVDGETTQTIQPGGGCIVKTDGTNWFSFGLVPAQQAFTPPVTGLVSTPQGYLTLSSDANNVVLSGDSASATAVYYTPFVGDFLPIYNGSNWVTYTFAQLTLTLNANHSADTLYDVFAFLNSGTVTIGTGPAWNSSTAGSASRGTGGGSAQIQRQNGLLVNSNSMTLRNGATTYTGISAGEATYLGTIFIDHTAGEVSCYRSWGQNRKWGVWNYYNRQSIVLQVGDSTSSWNYTTNTIRASNGAPSSYAGTDFNAGSGTTSNGAVIVTGMAEDEIDATFTQFLSNNGSTGRSAIGIGFNSTTAFSGTEGQGTFDGAANGVGAQSVAFYTAPPSLGVNVMACLEVTTASSSNAFAGTQADMAMEIRYRG